jgi:hypothetical protein
MFYGLLFENNSGRIKIALLSILIFFSATCPYEFVAITEIMKNPSGAADSMPGDASHEFIELTNLGTDTFNIDSLFLFDNPGGIDSVIPWNTLKQGVLLSNSNCIFDCRTINPGKSAVILDPDYITAITLKPSGAYSIKDKTVILTINNNSIGNNGLSDNDGLVIYKGTKNSINRIISFISDTNYQFTLSDTIRQKKTVASEGVSLIPTSLLFDPPAYMSCATGTSHGYYEQMNNNWLAQWKFFDPDKDNAFVPCSLACLKGGEYPSSNISWSITRTLSNSSESVATGVLDNTVSIARFFALLPLDSAVYKLEIPDNNVTNIWTMDISGVWTLPHAIKINEIFPRAQADCPEWFELVNNSPMTISIKGWKFGNAQDSGIITEDAISMEPGRYLVVTKNKALFSKKFPSVSLVCQPNVWHALDNYKDTLRLWTKAGRFCDTAAYNSAWFSQWDNQSLERVSLQKSGLSRESWVIAQNPTPGQPNASVAFRSADQPSLEIGPLLFTPNGDGKDDLLSIKPVFPASYAITVSIYGFNGRKYIDMPSTPQAQYLWDGKQSSGSVAPVGPFFVVATFKNDSKTMVIRKKGVLWR